MRSHYWREMSFPFSPCLCLCQNGDGEEGERVDGRMGGWVEGWTSGHFFDGRVLRSALPFACALCEWKGEGRREKSCLAVATVCFTFASSLPVMMAITAIVFLLSLSSKDTVLTRKSEVTRIDQMTAYTHALILLYSYTLTLLYPYTLTLLRSYTLTLLYPHGLIPTALKEKKRSFFSD